MPQYHFHLYAPDECFRDFIGAEVDDLAAAHARAVKLALRVMTFGGLAASPPDLRRWIVRVVDVDQRSMLTVIFPSDIAADAKIPIRVAGARAAIQRLDEALGAEPQGIVRRRA